VPPKCDIDGQPEIAMHGHPNWKYIIISDSMTDIAIIRGVFGQHELAESVNK